MRSIRLDNRASVVPVIMFIMTIFACGALYTVFFIEVGIPAINWMIPASDSKTLIMMLIYAMPLTVLIVGVLALLKAGIKREAY